MAFSGPFFALAAMAALFAGCVPRGQMCAGSGECRDEHGTPVGSTRLCVAGRCQPSAFVPAIQSARRVLAAPVEVAFVRRGDGAAGGRVPSVVALAKRGQGDAALLLRFAVPLPRGATLVEAYLLVDRVPDSAADEGAIALGLARILEPWDGRSASWARMPRLGAPASPRTRVSAWGPSPLRIDAKAVVGAWMTERRGDDFGVALVTEDETASGFAVRLAPALPATLGPGAGGGEAAFTMGEASRGEAGGEGHGPRLELYVK
jgi:hypothetical protein